ncbi:MAG: Circadian oscillating protein COP23 [Phormidesmis priestleyi Ana]|uniref:Circadian oscillating protein COP23 n=1 Tax=Phormidesmis priestleyi Ana TaxID=1666911 RepID=A0A0P7ZLU3_9CYAN|nr:MAG: Circadian oscillating protein COP23 [Phormidesmis priestleyi Ana]
MAVTHPSSQIKVSAVRLRRMSAAIGTALTLLSLSIAPAIAQSGEALPELEPGATSGRENDTISQLPDDDVRFECQLYNGAYTVMYLPESQPGQAYPWATPTNMGGGWDAERRCFTISDRLESYRPEGLAELQVGIENGYDVVCATTEQIPGLCKIVFTVPLGQNPIATRDLVFENLTLADNGTNTTIVNTYTGTGNAGLIGQITGALENLAGVSRPTQPSSTQNGASSINLKPFLDPADGGTGTAIRRNAAPSRSLSPDNFR